MHFSSGLLFYFDENSVQSLNGSKKKSWRVNFLCQSLFFVGKNPRINLLQEHFANFETADFSCGLRGSCFCSAFLPGFVQRQPHKLFREKQT